jgi:hypothetical protein
MLKRGRWILKRFVLHGSLENRVSAGALVFCHDYRNRAETYHSSGVRS